ncbi:MAG: hypothetical protein C0404_09230, partial [Verrucomicrobia bacterium]|nr:hypothetical protein [Verrucomicrobiota bacterium]
MARFELIRQREEKASLEPSGWESLGNTLLLQNARWFVKIRWVAMAAAATFGLLNDVLGDRLLGVGVMPQPGWPWAIAAGLLLSNIVYILLLRMLNQASDRNLVAANVFLQIAVDLVVLTVMVHMVGSIATFISFAYVFHVVLACVFFAPNDSVKVPVLATI